MCQSNEHLEHVISNSLSFLFAHESTSNLHMKNRTLKVGLPSMPRFHRYLFFVPKDTIVMNNIDTIVILIDSQVGRTDINDGTLHHSKISKVTRRVCLMSKDSLFAASTSETQLSSSSQSYITSRSFRTSNVAFSQ